MKDHGFEGLPDDTDSPASSMKSNNPHQSPGQNHGLDGLPDDTDSPQASADAQNPRQSPDQNHGFEGLPDDTDSPTPSVKSSNPRQSPSQNHGFKGLPDDTDSPQASVLSVKSTNPCQSVIQTPPGYKQTEAGVIPEDWGVARLGDVASIATGNTPPTRDLANYGDEFLFVGPGDLGFTKYIWQTEKMLSKKGFAISRCFPKGSILFVCIGSTIGKCGIAAKDLTSNQQINAVIPMSAFSADYIYYALSAAASAIKAQAGEQAVPIVNKTQFSETAFSLPPTLAEQRAIAEALSDADALIESLEQLIAKKRVIKQGAMQELLTGKRRLPGFEVKAGYKQTEVGVIPNDWDIPELGAILKSMQLGGNYKNSARETGWPLIKMGNLDRGSIKIDQLEFIDSSQPPASRDRLKQDDVLFNTRNTLDLVGKVAIWRRELREAYFNSNIMRMEFDKERVSSNHFMNYVLNTPQSLKSLSE
jgi:type I restriction enzyme, S subunit